jgi:hypothetical protein
MTRQSKYRSPAFIHSFLDEAGLNSSEFRAMAHVCRRAGDPETPRGCYASVASIAAICHLSEKTVRSALKSLVSLGWLREVKRPGKSTEYFPQFPLERNPAGCKNHGLPPSPIGTDPSPFRQYEGKQKINNRKGSSVPPERDGTSPPLSEENWQSAYSTYAGLIKSIHIRARNDPDNVIGILDLEEVESLAREVLRRNGLPESDEVFEDALKRLIRIKHRPRRKRLGSHNSDSVLEDPPFLNAVSEFG